MSKAIKKHISITKPKREKKLSAKITNELQENYKLECRELGIDYIPIKESPSLYKNPSMTDKANDSSL